jgi:hypothetical protein
VSTFDYTAIHPGRLWTSRVKLSCYRHSSDKGERKYSSLSFLTSALVGMSGLCHAPTALFPRQKTPGTHCTGGWVGLRAGLDTEGIGKILCLCWDQTPVVQSVVRDYTDWANPAPVMIQYYVCVVTHVVAHCFSIQVCQLSRYTVYFLYAVLLKAKAVPLHAMKALGGRGSIAATHSRRRR